MPELPEIEMLARGLRTTVRALCITAVRVYDHKTWRISPRQIKHVRGKTIVAVRRRAKWLIIDLSSHYSLIIHLKLTGQILYRPAASGITYFLGGHSIRNGKRTPKIDISLDATAYSHEPRFPNSHTRAVLTCKDGGQLFFQDQRKFGYSALYPTRNVTQYFAAKKLGREPVDRAYTYAYFTEQLHRHGRISIKAALLDQSIVAGIGNIYADESLFAAHLKPSRRVNTLTQPERRALWKATSRVIRQAIRFGGTSRSDFHQLNDQLGQYWKKRQVYQRTGQPCRRCRTPIKKTRLAGRGTHYCPWCQS